MLLLENAVALHHSDIDYFPRTALCFIPYFRATVILLRDNTVMSLTSLQYVRIINELLKGIVDPVSFAFPRGFSSLF